MVRTTAMLGLAAGLLAASSAGADDLFRSQDAAPGKAVRLGLYGNVAKDCKVGPAPAVNVLTPPKNGNLAVKSGKTKTDKVPGCSSLEAPVQGVFYEAKRGYSGADEVVYEVKQADGRTQKHTVRITVADKPGSAPAAPAKPASGSKPMNGVTDL